jgi:hypothetical protein
MLCQGFETTAAAGEGAGACVGGKLIVGGVAALGAHGSHGGHWSVVITSGNVDALLPKFPDQYLFCCCCCSRRNFLVRSPWIISILPIIDRKHANGAQEVQNNQQSDKEAMYHHLIWACLVVVVQLSIPDSQWMIPSSPCVYLL